MAAKKQGDRIGTLIKDWEALAKRLRSDVAKRARAAGLPKDLQSAANQLRKQAAAVAAQVEKRVHQLRKDLEKGSIAPGRRAKAGRRKHAAA